MIVRNTHDVKLAFEFLNLIKELSENFPAKDFLNDSATIETKKSLRQFLKRIPSERIIKGDVDGYVSLIELPERIKDKVTATDYFEDQERLVYVPSPYDCTGQKFTCWYKLFERRGRWMAYHCVGLDV